MSKGIVPFSYDSYQWTCARAIESQPQLSKDDIIMLIKLGIDYDIRLTPFSDTIENELFLRIHRDYEYDMIEY